MDNSFDQNNLEARLQKNHSQPIRKRNVKQDSESFQLEYHQIKKMGLKINKNKINIGEWSIQENQVYLKFLTQNYHSFLSYQSRRKEKVFYRLSKILKKRTPDQCRSHHQKFQLKNKDNLDAIISQIKQKISKSGINIFQQDMPNLMLKKLQKVNVLKPTEIEQEDSLLKILADSDKQMVIKIQSNTIKIAIKESFIAQW